ncbi:hypothetical protein [Pseudomonas sp. MWU16-30323]|uniref:hypothetical protein n=1 Tax=Pseudomonas sp. MWU16-30323 TaxID=2878094 RepID=UPI001CFAF566|nr:hypothetical protein [Pseudomonas sp. MWU16-30323]
MSEHDVVEQATFGVGYLNGGKPFKARGAASTSAYAIRWFTAGPHADPKGTSNPMAQLLHVRFHLKKPQVPISAAVVASL